MPETSPAPQFEDLEEGDWNWTPEERQVIAGLRKAYEGKCSPGEIEKLRLGLSFDYNQKIDEFENARSTDADKNDQQEIEHIMRFAAMMAAGGFSVDAAQFLQDVLTYDVGAENKLHRLPPELINRLRTAMDEHGSGILSQGIRDLEHIPVSIDDSSNHFRPPKIYPF